MATTKTRHATSTGPSEFGWRRRGGGYTSSMNVEAAPEWEGSTVQVCGLWPWTTGSSIPTVGAPLGGHLMSGATVCADPVGWFTNRLANTPSGFVLGHPGLGKSSLVRRMMTGMADRGVWPLVLGDVKPDYPPLIRKLGGQVITLSRGEGRMNPLDLMGAWGELASLPAEVRRWAASTLLGSQLNVLTGLVTLVRGTGGQVADHEATMLSQTLRALQLADDDTALPGPPPTIRDVLRMIQSRDRRLMLAALVSDDISDEAKARADYDDATLPLRRSLRALLADGPFGEIFDGPTQTHMQINRPVVFDMHDLNAADDVMRAAVQLVCWVYGSTCTALSNEMADHRLIPRTHYCLVMDELWQILKANPYMVERVNEITRLNRQMGIGQIMCTHTMNDLRMGDDRLTDIAFGFVERSSMVFLGGLADSEFGNLETAFLLSQREKTLLTDWSVEAQIDPTTGRGTAPPGRGHFLLKLGKRPGIPFVVRLTPAEMRVNDTNTRWDELAVA